MAVILIVFLASYLIGSVPSGVLLTKWADAPDIREHGSKNIGATNVWRVGGKYLAIGTLFFDVLKGVIPVLITKKLYPDLVNFVALCAVLGHLFPFWLNFKGGKGVSTCFGVLLALSWPVALIGCFVWINIVFFTKYASLGSLTAMLSMMVAMWFWEDKSMATHTAILTGLVFFTHRENIHRLFLRTEPKIGKKGKQAYGQKV